MPKINKISIVHSVSRKFENALKECLKICEDCSVEVKEVLSIDDKSIQEKFLMQIVI